MKKYIVLLFVIASFVYADSDISIQINQSHTVDVPFFVFGDYYTLHGISENKLYYHLSLSGDELENIDLEHVYCSVYHHSRYVKGYKVYIEYNKSLNSSRFNLIINGSTTGGPDPEVDGLIKFTNNFKILLVNYAYGSIYNYSYDNISIRFSARTDCVGCSCYGAAAVKLNITVWFNKTKDYLNESYNHTISYLPIPTLLVVPKNREAVLVGESVSAKEGYDLYYLEDFGDERFYERVKEGEYNYVLFVGNEYMYDGELDESKLINKNGERLNYSFMDYFDVLDYFFGNETLILVNNGNFFEAQLLALENKTAVIFNPYGNYIDYRNKTKEEIEEEYMTTIKNSSKNIDNIIVANRNSFISYFAPYFAYKYNGSMVLPYIGFPNSDEAYQNVKNSIKNKFIYLTRKGFMANNPRYKIDDLYITILGDTNELPMYKIEDPLYLEKIKRKFNISKSYIRSDIPYGIISGNFQDLAVGRILNVNVQNQKIRNALLISEYRHNKYIDILNYDGGMFTSLILKKQMNNVGVDVKRIGEKRVEFNNETWEELKGNIGTIKEILKMIVQGKDVSWNYIFAYIKALSDIVRIGSYIVMETDTSNWNFMSDDFLHIEELTNESFNDIQDYDVLFVSGKGNQTHFMLPNTTVFDDWILSLFELYSIPYRMDDLEYKGFFYFDYDFSGDMNFNTMRNLVNQGSYGVGCSDAVHDIAAITRTANFFKFGLYYRKSLGSSLKDSGNVEIGTKSRFSIPGLKEKEFYNRIYLGNPKFVFDVEKTYNSSVYFGRIKRSLKDGVIDYVKDKIGLLENKEDELYKEGNYTTNYTINGDKIRFYDYDDVLYYIGEPLIPYVVYEVELPNGSVVKDIEFEGSYVNYTNLSLDVFDSEWLYSNESFTVYPEVEYWVNNETYLDGRVLVYVNVPLMRYFHEGNVSMILENFSLKVLYKTDFKFLNVSYINDSFELYVYSKQNTNKELYVFENGDYVAKYNLSISEGVHKYKISMNVSLGKNVYSFVFDDDYSKELEVSNFPDLRINEIMFNPEGKEVWYEWIEVYVGDNVSFKDIGVKDNKESYCDKEGVLEKGEFLLLVRNESAIRERYNYTGENICEVDFSLSNSGDEFELLWRGNEIDEVSYQGGKEAYSLQLIDGEWVKGLPTPWKENFVEKENPITLELLKNKSLEEEEIGKILKVYLDKDECVKENVDVVFDFYGVKNYSYALSYDVGCSKTIYLNEGLDSGNYTLCVSAYYKDEVEKECYNFSVESKKLLRCNVSVEVLLENNVFLDKKSNEYYFYLKDNDCSNFSRKVKIEYWIEDLFGKIIKKKYVSEQDFECEKLIKRSWNPLDIEGSEAYYIYVNVSDLGCNQSYAFNKKLVVVKGSNKKHFKSYKRSSRKYLSSKDYVLNVYVERNIENNESFDVLVEIYNRKGKGINLEVYSYGYEGKRLRTYGYNNGSWVKKWKGNIQEVYVKPYSKKDVWLKNKFVVDKNGSYLFKVRVKGDINRDIVQRVKVVKYEKNMSLEELKERNKEKSYENVSVECLKDRIKIKNNEIKRVHLKILENGKEKGIYVFGGREKEIRYRESVNVSVLSYDMKHVYGNCSITIKPKFNKITGRYISTSKESGFKRWLRKWLWFLF